MIDTQTKPRTTMTRFDKDKAIRFRENDRGREGTSSLTVLFALVALIAVLAGCSKAEASESEEAPDRAGFEGQMGYYSGGDLGVQ